MYDEFLARRVQNGISGPWAGGVAGPEVVGGRYGGRAAQKGEGLCVAQ